MRTPTLQERNELVALVRARDEDAIYELLNTIGLPDEVASVWYAFILDEKPETEQEVQHLLNKAWK